MKKQAILLVFALTFAVVLCGSVSAANTWVDEKVAIADYGHEISHNSLALDSSGNPHISYQDRLDLKYAYKDDSGWHNKTVDSGVHSDQTSIALDSSGRPHISYSIYDGEHFNIKYAYYDGSLWHIETALSGGGAGYFGSSLVLDSSNNPHISCESRIHDGTNYRVSLRYAYRDGSGWHAENAALLYSGSFSSSPEGRIDASLALDPSNNPHISYYYPFTHYLEYTYKDSSGWNYETVDNLAGDTSILFGDTSIALDSSNNPHISYVDNLGHVKYAVRSGRAWITETVESTGLFIFSTSLALDSQDNPHISYSLDRWADSLRYAVKSGGIWTIEGVPYTGESVYLTSLALDSQGNPHISYKSQVWIPADELYYDYLGHSYVIGSGNPTNTTTTVNNANNFAGKTVKLVAHITDYYGNPVGEGTVRFTVGKANPVMAAVLNGMATYTWTIPANWTKGLYTITAQYLGTTNYDPSTGNATLTVNPSAYLDFTKTVSSGTHYYGDTIHYYLTIKNNGPDAATGISVFDRLPNGLTYKTSSANIGSYKLTTHKWTIGTLKAGQTAKLNITAMIKKIGTIKNTATLTQTTYPTTAKTRSVSFTVPPMVTIPQLITASRQIKAYYESHNHKLPTSMIIAGQTITMPQLLKLLTTATLNINTGNLNPMIATAVGNPTNPGGSYTPGNLYKNQYLSVAQNIKNFINTNKRAPNYAVSSLGNIPFSRLVYMYAKIINFYGQKNRLPNYVTV